MEPMLENLKRRYEKVHDEKTLVLYTSKLIKFKEYQRAIDVIEEYNNFDNINIVLYYVQALRFLLDIDKAEEIINKYLFQKEYSNEEMSKLYYELYQIENGKVVKMNQAASKENRKLNEDERQKKKEYEQTGKNFLLKAIDYDKNLYAYLSLANNEFFDSNFEEALKYYQIIVDNFDNADKINYAQVQIAKIYIQFNRNIEALEILEKKEDPANPLYNQILLNIGYAYMGLGQSEKADGYFRKSIPSIKYPRYEYLAFAKNLYSLGKYDEALKYLDDLLKRSNKDLNYYKALQLSAKIQEELGNSEEAFKLYLLMLDGTNKDKQIANIKIGSYYRRKNEFAKALEYYEKVLSGNNVDKAMAYLEMSKLYKITGEREKELYCLDKTLEQNFGDTGKIEKAVYLRKIGQTEESEKILLELANKNTKDSGYALIELARLYFYSGETKKAYEYCNKINRKDTKNYNRAVQFKIKMAMVSNNREELDDLLNEIKDCNNSIDKSFYHLVLGNLAFEREDYELALDHYDLVTAIENKSEKMARTAYIYAIGYKDKEKSNEILNELEQSDKSISTYVLNTKLKILIDSNELEEAINLIKQNIYHGKIYKNNISDLARKYDEQGNLEEASNIYKIAIAATNDPYHTYQLADLYNRYRQYDQAEYWFKSIIDKNLKNKDYALLKLSRIYINQKEYDKAYDCISKLEGTKLDGPAKMEMALICMDNGKVDEAIKIYESMLNTENKYFALYQLAKLARNRKDYDKGLALLEELSKSNIKQDKTLAMLEKARILSDTNKNKEANQIYADLINKLKEDEACRKYVELDDIESFEEEMYFYTEEDQSMLYSIILEKARLERKMGNTKEAVKYYSMIKEGYERLFAACDMIEMYLDEGNIKEAENIVETIKTNNYINQYYLYKSRIERSKENYQLAKEYLDKVTKGDFNLEKTYLEAIICSCENKNEEAIEKFESLTKEHGLYKALSIYQLAHYYLDKLDYEKARYYFEMLEKNGNKEAISNLIVIDIREGKYADALKRNDILSKDEAYKATAINNYNLISKALNITLPRELYGLTSYKREQIDNYDENKAIAFVSENNKDAEHCKPFNEDIDIPLLFELIDQVLIPENLSRAGAFDEYIIPFKNAGIKGEQYIKVLTIPNTLDIITMYPVNEDELKHYKIR